MKMQYSSYSNDAMALNDDTVRIVKNLRTTIYKEKAWSLQTTKSW